MTKHQEAARVVQATRMGYYGDARRRPGDVFCLDRPEDFTPKWMKKIDPSTPLRTTGPQEALDRDHDDRSPLGRVRRVSDPDDDDGVGRVTTDDEDPFT